MFTKNTLILAAAMISLSNVAFAGGIGEMDEVLANAASIVSAMGPENTTIANVKDKIGSFTGDDLSTKTFLGLSTEIIDNYVGNSTTPGSIFGAIEVVDALVDGNPAQGTSGPNSTLEARVTAVKSALGGTENIATQVTGIKTTIGVTGTDTIPDILADVGAKLGGSGTTIAAKAADLKAALGAGTSESVTGKITDIGTALGGTETTIAGKIDAVKAVINVQSGSDILATITKFDTDMDEAKASLGVTLAADIPAVVTNVKKLLGGDQSKPIAEIAGEAVISYDSKTNSAGILDAIGTTKTTIAEAIGDVGKSEATAPTSLAALLGKTATMTDATPIADRVKYMNSKITSLNTALKNLLKV